MAVKRGRKKKPSSRKKSRRTPAQSIFSFQNTAILLLSLACVAFVTSILHRYFRGGTPVGSELFSSSPPGLSVNYEEAPPLSAIEVEVLNGCGVQGLGQQFTDFLRSHQVDVVKTENAGGFDYEKTLIIQRNEIMGNSYRIAELLNIPKSDTTRLLIQPDLSLETDVTLIIGKDYTTIEPLQEFLSTPP
ncbi:MAG: LytR C-terminal domain-containing protein [Candidatus Neomarinimicrobiota bacterium]